MAGQPVPADPAATVIVMRPLPEGFELLMVRRPDRGAFGGIVVFPGGKVDPIDDSDLARSVVRSNHDDSIARSAALRELAEETGLLATSDGVVASPGQHGEDLYSELDRTGRALDGSALILVSRWVTPVVASRRFDTRFYLLEALDPPLVRLDENELTEYAWVTPSAALSRYKSGEWPMILPTLAHLRWLSKRRSMNDAIRSADGADGRTLIQPRMLEDGSLLPVHMPADR